MNFLNKKNFYNLKFSNEFSIRFREGFGVSEIAVGGAVTPRIPDLVGKDWSVGFGPKVNLKTKTSDEVVNLIQ